MPIYNSEAYKKWQEKYGVSQPKTNKTTNSGKQSNSASSNKSKSAVAGAAKKGAETAKKGNEIQPYTSRVPVYGMTKAEYDMRRSSNPSMPEHGSYEYYKQREATLRPIMEEIANDFDRQDPTYKAWVGNYEAGLMPDSTNEHIKEKVINLSKKFKYQDSVIAEYEDVNNQLLKYDRYGIHYDDNGNIDAKSGAEEAKYAKERYQRILRADPLTNLEMGQGLRGELPEDKQREYNQKESMAMAGLIESSKEDAYNYYEKNKNNVYEDDLWGRLTGNYKIGRTGIKSNQAGYTSFAASSDDIEASEVYQALSNRIQSRNIATFKNNGATDKVISIIGQYLPQGVDQAVIGTVGKVVGSLVGSGNGGKSAATAYYMFEQTAGATYVRLLQESDLSVEDAKKLASSEALASAAIEYGLDYAAGKLWENVGKSNVVKNLPVNSNKLTKLLTDIGISEQGAKTILNIAKNTGKLIIHSMGEGVEEGWQEGVSITAEKYAQEGETASPFKMLLQSLWLPQYSKDEFSRMGESFMGGAVIGFGQGGVDALSSYGINKLNSTFGNNDTPELTFDNPDTPTQTLTPVPIGQTTSIDPIEQAAREVVAERTRNNPALAVETKSINGETITPEDAKKASAYGKHGSELLADAVNKAEGRSFSEVKGEMHIPYMAGYSNQNVNISTDFEQEAYFAGKKDRIMDNTTAKEKAKTATVYESGVVKNENFNKLSKASQEVLSTLAKDHKMSVEMQDKIVASIVNGVEKRAAGSHFDGKMEGSMSTEKPLIKWAIHEDGHRMEQMATDEWNVLANALYERAERLGRRSELGLSQGTRFDKMKADHDNAGITKDTSGYFGEVVMRELETIFASPEEFNAWRAELDGNAQVKTAWQKFMDFFVELINKAKATLAKAIMTKEARAQAREQIAELEHIKELYTNAYKATSEAVTKRANEVRNKETKTEVKSKSVESKPTTAPAETKTKSEPTYPSVKVGDVYASNGNTYTITKRENGRTTYTVMRKNGDTSTKEVSNVVADINFTRADAYQKISDVQLSLKDTDYMEAVENNDMETAQRMVDEKAKKAGAFTTKNGEVRKFYHGTRKPFNSFDAEKSRFGTYGFGFYFSPSESMAVGYGDIKNVYLMTDNFATRTDHNITARQVKKFAEKYGLDLSKTILRNADTIKQWVSLNNDLTILEGLQEFVRKDANYTNETLLKDLSKYFGYDGISENTEYVLWDNHLVKSADPVTYDDNDNVIPLSKRFNEQKNDIRYSLEEDTNNISTKDQKQLLDTIEQLKGQFEVTKFAKADAKKLAKMTRDILKEYDSKADTDETRKAIDELYQYIANGEGQNPAAWNDVYNRAYKIAQNIVENALVTDDYMYQEYKSLRDYLRNTPLKFNSGYDSVPTAYESFNDFRKKNMGRLKFTNDGMSIDSFYQELSDLYPEYFDSEEQTNTADQLERIVDVLDEIQPTEVNPFDGQVQQASMHLANDLINRFFDIPQAKPTFADKAERRVINTRIKAKKQLDKVREQRDIKIEKEKAKRRDSLAKMSEKKKASVLRARIMRHTGELHKTLTKATDQKHIPPELENAVLSLLYNINLESNYTYDVNTDSYKKNDKGYPTNKTNAFRALKDVYAEIAKNNDYGLTLASELIDTTNEGVANIFDEVMKLSDKKIADMTSEELTKIYDAIRIVEHSITTANKMFAMQKWEGLSETAKEFEKSVATRRAKHALMKSHLTLDIETPITFFSHFGEAGNELFQALRNAQDNEQGMIDELAERVQKIVSLEQVQKAEKELFEFTTTEGKKLTLSKDQIMDIYLLYNRKQGKKHLLYDPQSEHFGEGIHQPEIKSKHIRRDTESTRLTKADLENIISKLSAEDKAIADKLQKTTLLLAEWGNKACLDVFGYEKFNDPNYWTIKSAKESINQTPEKNKDIARSIKNMGSAKAVEDKATNALDIGGVFNVFNQHASDMICYSAWLGAMEDATKLYNYTFRDENGYKTNRTFVSMLEKYAGEGGSKYYFNLLKDIQNGIGLAPDTATERIYTKLFGMAAKAKVAYKATVVAQQPMAIVRAASVLNPLYITQAIAKGGVNLSAWAASKATGGKINASEWYGGWERALKYAPIAARKAIGGYEINANDSGLKGVLYKPTTKKGKFVDAVKESPLWAAGKADEITWGILWNACEIETNQNKSLEKGSEEYYEAVSELFTKVINETQVVDGVLQRSQMMRSSSGWVKPLTTFKGEPTMALNGVMRAYDKVRYEADPAKRGKAIKKFARATSVFLASAVFTAFARSLAVGGTGEDDEEYWKKVWKSFSGIQGDEDTWFDFVKNIGLKSDAVNNINPLTWLPITSELMSAMQGYDVERLDVASVTDFYNVAKKFIDSLDKEGKQTVGYSARQVLLKAAEFTGYSPYNLIRDIEGAIRTVRVETNDVKGLYEMEKWRTKPASNVSKYVDILYKAYSTDSDDYEYIYNDMIENGVDAEKIETGMETRMKKAEGVEKTSELTKRYMSPDVEKKYDNSLSKIRTSDVWKLANATQRKEAEADLYNFLTSDSEDMKKARDEAILNDVDSSEYALWQIAIEMADQPKGEEGSGTYDLKEKAEAINSLNLGKKEMAYFYGKGLNKYAKDELNQVISDKIDIQDYINFKAATSDMTADKNANGKSIRNSKKRKIVNYLNSANLTDEEWNYFYYEIMDYKE